MPFRSVSCPLERGSVMALRKYQILKGCDVKQSFNRGYVTVSGDSFGEIVTQK